MGRGLNRAELIGRIGNDVEEKETNGGTSVVNLRIATDESYKNKDGENVEQTEWHNVVFFGRLAEVVGEYMNKGDRLYVAGNLRTRKWEDREGTERYTTEIRGSEMVMLGSKGGGNGNGQASGSPKKNRKQDSPAPVENDGDGDGYADDDDLPF
jgi:single-strand DNA-binding protein